ncbi:unnamed protein product [Protopolystoma xenopodis]|uniref:Uncharacterized protein n=1 Tax=Protopolystoma xenopodis TaxID=117903 RepID=A0A3S5FBT8_9PLAT|nr:unnamed protein product [Protopolystoma xenopodis]
MLTFAGLESFSTACCQPQPSSWNLAHRQQSLRQVGLSWKRSQVNTISRIFFGGLLLPSLAWLLVDCLGSVQTRAPGIEQHQMGWAQVAAWRGGSKALKTPNIHQRTPPNLLIDYSQLSTRNSSNRSAGSEQTIPTSQEIKKEPTFYSESSFLHSPNFFFSNQPFGFTRAPFDRRSESQRPSGSFSALKQAWKEAKEVKGDVTMTHNPSRMWHENAVAFDRNAYIPETDESIDKPWLTAKSTESFKRILPFVARQRSSGIYIPRGHLNRAASSLHSLTEASQAHPISRPEFFGSSPLRSDRMMTSPIAKGANVPWSTEPTDYSAVQSTTRADSVSRHADRFIKGEQGDSLPIRWAWSPTPIDHTLKADVNSKSEFESDRSVEFLSWSSEAITKPDLRWTNSTDLTTSSQMEEYTSRNLKDNINRNAGLSNLASRPVSLARDVSLASGPAVLMSYRQPDISLNRMSNKIQPSKHMYNSKQEKKWSLVNKYDKVSGRGNKETDEKVALRYNQVPWQYTPKCRSCGRPMLQDSFCSEDFGKRLNIDIAAISPQNLIN